MHFDGEGLYLQVYGPQSRSWVYRYALNGKTRTLGLGSARNVTLAVARKKRDKARAQVRSDGVDPVAERRRDRQRAADRVVTFKQAAETYITAQMQGDTPWRNARHAQQWGDSLKKYAYPVIGERLVAEIDRKDIIRVLEPIWTRIPESARRLRGRIETVVDWSIARGDRPEDRGNPASRGPLVKGLAKQTDRTVHHAALPYDAIAAFLDDLRGRGGTAVLALEFAILTAGRTGEVIGARWNEIDMAAKFWTVPADRMKAGKPHRVPLSAAAIAVLERAREVTGATDGFVFPNVGRGRPLSNMAMLRMLARMGRSDLTVHGFRSTFRDWAAETTNYPNHVVEMALAHAIDDKVEAAYRRGDLFEKRRRLMDAWGEYCSMVPTSGEVVHLRQVR
jgi:integrase